MSSEEWEKIMAIDGIDDISIHAKDDSAIPAAIKQRKHLTLSDTHTQNLSLSLCIVNFVNIEINKLITLIIIKCDSSA
jgi:hypothetical protein